MRATKRSSGRVRWKSLVLTIRAGHSFQLPGASKGLSKNKISFYALPCARSRWRRRGMRFDGVVPGGVEGMRGEAEGLPLLGSDLPSCHIALRIQPGVHPQALASRGMANEVHHRLIAHQRLAAPVQTDKGEHPVLNLVPFAGAGGIVTHCHRDAGVIAELL